MPTEPALTGRTSRGAEAGQPFLAANVWRHSWGSSAIGNKGRAARLRSRRRSIALTISTLPKTATPHMPRRRSWAN